MIPRIEFKRKKTIQMDSRNSKFLPQSSDSINPRQPRFRRVRPQDRLGEIFYSIE